MDIDEDRIREIVDSLDPEKLKGRYIHFGHFMEDFIKTGGFSLIKFYGEVFLLFKAFLSQFGRNENVFNNLLENIGRSFESLKNSIKNIKFEQIQKELQMAYKIANEHLDELKREMGKDEEDFFF